MVQRVLVSVENFYGRFSQKCIENIEHQLFQTPDKKMKFLNNMQISRNKQFYGK